jgi:starch-binding outer membrane protein, SusD/RagB family
MNMKKIKILLPIAFTLAFVAGCNEDDFLNKQPKGSLSGDQLLDPAGAESLVTSAYAGLAQNFPEIGPAFFSPASNWSFGDMRSDDAYKGGGGTGDISDYHSLEVGNIAADNGTVNNKWRALYYAIARTNSALRALNQITPEDFPLVKTRIAEVKVLRGHFYFDLAKNFGAFPYIDETVAETEISKVKNELTREQLWSKIEENFSSAIADLPEVSEQPGRINKYVAHAYLAKAHIFQSEWNEALQNADAVIASGKYSLFSDFTKLWDVESEHGPEFVFSIEYSTEDGSANGNLNWGNLLNTPRGPAYNGDGFHVPSQNLVNAYKVDANGLPLFTSFNDVDVDPGTAVDPRLDHTIGRQGIPWKNFGQLYTSAWSRNIGDYGPYGPKKYQIDPTSPFMVKGWPWGGSPLNWPLIKFSDVLLWKAEALVELNTDLEEARTIVNDIRLRAKNSPYVQKLDGSSNAANYQIGLYPSNLWTQDYAREAVRFERRLELALEGHRFYDLVRWGEAADVLEKFYDEESLKRSYYATASFVPGKHEYLPVPQSEIDRSAGIYTQYTPYQ